MKVKSARIFEILELEDEAGNITHFYKGGVRDGQPFVQGQPRSSVVRPALTPAQVQAEKEKERVERVSSVDAILKSHAKKDETSTLPPI